MSWTRPAVGALSGNFVMDEKRGRPAASLAAYCASVGVVLLGLAVLGLGERGEGAGAAAARRPSYEPLSDEAGDAGAVRGGRAAQREWSGARQTAGGLPWRT